MVAVAPWPDAFAKGSPLTGHKNDAPVEVTSDTLEVFQLENRAVFSGHVVAIQGDVRLKADQMTIYYNPPKEPEGGKPEVRKGAGPAPDAVKKIDATGGVLLSTPEETASGENGTYDVEHNMIYLNNNVTLTRGQNVLRGTHLTYNFTTGRSVLTSADDQKAAGSAQPVPGKGKQRVRALFVPEGSQGVTKP